MVKPLVVGSTPTERIFVEEICGILMKRFAVNIFGYIFTHIKGGIMKITKIKNIENFMKVVNECKGDVFLDTLEGDHLNLKSKLTQYIALANIFGGDANLGELVIKADQEDIIKIAEFLVNE